jgi:hypothetical protein
MFRQCFLVSSCLLFGWSAVRWADWDIHTLFFGEQLPFGWSFSSPIVGFGRSDILFVEQLPLG